MEVPNDDAQQSTQDTSQESNPNSLDQLKWIDDGVSEIGWIEDGAGNKFAWNERVRADGAVGYRCIYRKPSQKRCTAVARRFFFDRSTRDRERAIILETPHVHLYEPEKRKNIDGQGPKSGIKLLHLLEFFGRIFVKNIKIKFVLLYRRKE